VKSIDNGVSKSDYAYNNRNLLTSETQTLSGCLARVVSYDYDAALLRQGNGGQDGCRHWSAQTLPLESSSLASCVYFSNNANQYTSITGLTPISHDANGNLRLQNNVTYSWDSENRLLSGTPNTPALGDKSLVHTYDGQARRVTRTIREWTASGWTNTETTHFIYDGWNVIEEYQLNISNSVLVRNLTWGQDLGGSSSLQAAGGVGGLIMVEEINGSTTTAYNFHYDGNGNVTEVTDLSGNSAASYRYDAFGNTLVSTGSYALQNRYRFSTKPLDGEVTNAPLYYYGYRYYDPVTGRWPSRDPIEEEGGINLYGFVENDGLHKFDSLGMMPDISYLSTDGGITWHQVRCRDLQSQFDEVNAAICEERKLNIRVHIVKNRIQMDLVIGGSCAKYDWAVEQLTLLRKRIDSPVSDRVTAEGNMIEAEATKCGCSLTDKCDISKESDEFEKSESALNKALSGSRFSDIKRQRCGNK
jgi:RHS repeat-associated protein